MDYMDDQDDPERLWVPLWFREHRGFVDKRAKVTDMRNDIIKTHLPTDVSTYEANGSELAFHFGEELTIQISVSNERPSGGARSECVSRKALDTIRLMLRYALAHNYDPKSDSASQAIAILRILEEGNASLRLWRQRTSAVPANQTQGWDASAVVGMTQYMRGNPFGVSLGTIKDTALHLLGKSIQEICSDIPDWLRILHVEPVFRDDLVARFLRRRDEMVKQLSKLQHSQLRRCVTPNMMSQNSVQSLAEELARPRVSFHGSSRRNTSFIVRYGFIIPGETIGTSGRSLAINAGASYGLGVYSSPDPVFATSYASGYHFCDTRNGITLPTSIPGFRLIVCATLMGRALEVHRETTRWTTELANPTANSHISPDGLEYIVFDASQILPCYVLHLDCGAERAQQEFEMILKNSAAYFKQRAKARRKEADIPIEPSCPAEVQEKKKALKAAAKKWFPYGYGPAQGDRFVIEKIGHVSDDEEDYGDYQALRNEQVNEIGVKQGGHDDKASWFDEYQTVRVSMKNVNQ